MDAKLVFNYKTFEEAVHVIYSDEHLTSWEIHLIGHALEEDGIALVNEVLYIIDEHELLND